MGEDAKRVHISPAQNFLAGGFGGICLVTAGHPLDTIKVRLQTMSLLQVSGQPPPYNGAFDCIRKTFQRERLRGFYRGMATPLVGVTPIYAVCFFGYSLGRKMQTPAAPDGTYSHGQIFNAGMLSAIFTLPLIGPGERIKCLLQVQAQHVPKYSGPIDCVRQLYQAGGFRSLFRGTLATLLRDVPASGVYFVTYEGIRKHFQGRNEPTSQQYEAFSTLMAGGTAGILFWVAAMPADVIKSRLQTSPEHLYPNGIRDVVRAILRHEGVAGFYKGASAVFMRAFPANAACFLGYEVAMKFLNWVAPQL